MNCRFDYRLEYVLPAGTYYIGDPCYVFEDRWGDFLGSVRSPLTDRFVGLAGIVPEGRPPADSMEDLFRAVVFSTKHGDGFYRSTHESVYPVDAGLLGAVPVDMPDGSPEPGEVTVETFDEDFVCSVDSRTGAIRFGHIRIDTGGAT